MKDRGPGQTYKDVGLPRIPRSSLTVPIRQKVHENIYLSVIPSSSSACPDGLCSFARWSNSGYFSGQFLLSYFVVIVFKLNKFSTKCSALHSSIVILQDATQTSSSQTSPQPLSASAAPHQLPPITAASPAVLSTTDPNASIQSILANSRKDSTPQNGQLPTWSIQSVPNLHTAPHQHHVPPPPVNQVCWPADVKQFAIAQFPI